MIRRVLLAVLLAVGCAPEEPPACADGLVEDTDGACVPARCGAGPWGSLERTAETLHVAPDGRGDGTEDDPFRDLADALDAAADLDDAHIALAAGTWPGDVTLNSSHGDLRIEGRCAELVILDGGEEEEAVIQVVAGTQQLSGLTLRGGGVGLLVNRQFAGATIQATAEGLVVESSLRSGILVIGAGAALDLVDVHVRDVEGFDGSRGVGFSASDGAIASMTGGSVDRASTFAVEAYGAGTQLVVRGTQVIGTRRRIGNLGVGLASFDGALLRAEGVEVTDSANVGAVVDGATLELVDVQVFGTGTDPGPTAIGGVEALAGGVLVAERLVVGSGHEVGVLVGGAGAHATLTDPDLRGGLPEPDADPDANVGLTLVEGGRVEVTGGRIEGWLGAGVSIASGCSAELDGVVLAGNGHPRTDGIVGALGVLGGGSATLRDVRVEGSIGVGVVVASSGPTSRLVAEDLVVGGTRAGDGAARSAGVVLSGAAELEGDRLELVDNAWVALLVQGGDAEAVVRDSTIRDGRASGSGEAGYGVVASGGGAVALERVTLEGLREVAALAWGEGSSLTAEDLTVPSLARGTDGGTGAAVAATGGAQATLLRLVASDLPGPALVAYGGGRIDAQDAVISRCEFAGAAAYDGGAMTLVGARIEDSLRSPRDGGGLGVFVDASTGGDVRLESSTFLRLRGPALHARGPGRFELIDLLVEECGQDGGLPGAIQAIDVPAWDGALGLSVQDLRLVDLPGDGILLHGSGARLDSVQVDGVGGEPLYVQACEEVAPPVLIESSALDPVCRPWWREIDPALRFELEIVEIDVQ